MWVLIVMLTFMLIKVHYAVVRVLKFRQKSHAYWWGCKWAQHEWNRRVCACAHVCDIIPRSEAQCHYRPDWSFSAEQRDSSIEITLMGCLKHLHAWKSCRRFNIHSAWLPSTEFRNQRVGNGAVQATVWAATNWTQTLCQVDTDTI